MDIQEVKKQAEKEIKEEGFKKLVEKEKERLRSKKVWFPWRIRFINLNEV